MKAAVLYALGELPRFEEIPVPVPGDGEEFIEVTAAPVLIPEAGWSLAWLVPAWLVPGPAGSWPGWSRPGWSWAGLSGQIATMAAGARSARLNALSTADWP